MAHSNDTLFRRCHHTGGDQDEGSFDFRPRRPIARGRFCCWWNNWSGATSAQNSIERFHRRAQAVVGYLHQPAERQAEFQD